MRIRTLEQGALLVLPWWKGYQRGKRMPRPAVPVRVPSRSCSLESRGALRRRCIATKRDGTGCGLRYSFQPQPVGVVQQYSRDATVAQNEKPASPRIDYAQDPSKPSGLLRPIERLFSLYSTSE